MKKTILRAMVFGAMLLSPMFVVSCSDDYDDSELKTNISATQTDVTALQAKLDALTAAQAALPTAADIETAKNAAIAAAKTASDGAIDTAVEAALQDAFDADATQLTTVQGLIDDLKADLEASIAANGLAIDANGAAIGVNGDAIEALDARMQIVETNIVALQNFVTATNAALTANEDAIAANTVLINAAQALADANAELLANYKEMIDANKFLIDANVASILANSTSISGLQTAVTALQTAVANLQTALADAISELNGKITTILTQLSISNSVYYENITPIKVGTMEVMDDIDFGSFKYPYKKGDLFDSLQVWNGENIMVVANPSTIDLDQYTFTLATSQEMVPGLKLLPSSYDGLLTSSNYGILTKADNNIIQFEAEIDTAAFHNFLSENLSSNTVAMDAPHNMPVYAVVATDMDGRDVRTGYFYELYPREIEYDLATSVERYPRENGAYAPDKTGFGADNYQGVVPAANVYKQYISLAPGQMINGVAVDSADFIGIGEDEVIDGNDSIKVSCTNKYAYNHQPIEFIVHYLYPDGTRTAINTSLTFGELEFADVTLNIDAYIDPSKAFDAQSSDTIALTDLMNSVGTLSNWMNKAKQVKVEAYDENSASDMPFTGTSFNSYDETDGTVMLGSPETMTSFTDSLRTLFVTFDASEITEVGTYGSLFNFYDANGQLVNRVYVYLHVKGMLPFAAPKKVTAVWNAPILDVNTVWLQTSSDITSVSYNMNKSYSEDITNMTFEDLSEVDTLQFGSNQSVTTPLTTVMADQDDCTFNVTSAYPIFGTNATDWAVRDTFSMKFRSAVAEANPNTMWDAATNSLRYENGGELNISKIDAADPSNSSDVIHYLGTLPSLAGVADNYRDYRIKSIDFMIVDPEGTASSDNLGMVQIESGNGSALTANADGSYTISSAMNSAVTSIKVVAIPDMNNEYPAVGSDVTLNLVLKVTDVFGFVKEVTLPFQVLSAEL